MRFSEKKVKELRSKVLAFAAQVLEASAAQAEMPTRNESEDAWMRDELTNIAADLYEEASLP